MNEIETLYAHIRHYIQVKNGMEWRSSGSNCPRITRDYLASKAMQLEPVLWVTEGDAYLLIHQLACMNRKAWGTLREQNPVGYELLKNLFDEETAARNEAWARESTDVEG